MSNRTQVLCTLAAVTVTLLACSLDCNMAIASETVFNGSSGNVSLAAARIDRQYKAWQPETGWSGNMVKNPGFEEDFINTNAEGHVLSFKGDWFYNQKDLRPDYWQLNGDAKLIERISQDGKHALQLGANSSATQSYPRASSQHGGGAWGGGETRPIPVRDGDRPGFNQPWKATVRCRGGGTLQLGSVQATAPAGNQWHVLAVELPAAEVGGPEQSVAVTLKGPGSFDDVVIQTRLHDTPNLLPDPSFEHGKKSDDIDGWSKQQKFRAIGPTYYVWTDWNHAFRPNRGPVQLDDMIAHSGKQSLRFDVYPGDEKFVESNLIQLNQTTPGVIEVSAFVRADRIMLIDIRCVDEEGVWMPAQRPRAPEYSGGGSFLYGNGTFGWRWVRKFFATPIDPDTGQPRSVKGVRARLCARGFNAHTLDDSGTRPQSLQVGTVWWDDVRVTERPASADQLRARGVTIPAPVQPSPDLATDAKLDFGQRRVGDNTLTYQFTNGGEAGNYQLRLTTTFPGSESVDTASKSIHVAPGQRAVLTAPYTVHHLTVDLEKQATFRVALLRDDNLITGAHYAFNTWPVVVDFDVARSYNLPQENPVTVSMNLGVSDETLSKVTELEMQLKLAATGEVLSSQTWDDPRAAFQSTIADLPTEKEQSYEFNLPSPQWWVDRNNLIVTQVDLSPLKVWPHDYPVRDTVLVLRGLDAGGNELFTDQSDPFCRMDQRPALPPIESVSIREDGALLINGEPKFITGATHQQQRITHTPEIIAQLGLTGHRLWNVGDLASIQDAWNTLNIYALQAKPPGDSGGGTRPNVELTSAEQEALVQFVEGGGLKNIVTIQTGGWEGTIDVENAEEVSKHRAMNEWIAELTGRPLAISTSGAYNAWWLSKLVWYDINHAETEMWGPMDFNVIWTPYMKRARPDRPTAWAYLPQLYENHPYERLRFETYENIVRGSVGTSMIQGIGDPSFLRGLAGELRALEAPLNGTDPAPNITIEPANLSHKVTSHQGKTYILATNCGPIATGNWDWNIDIKHSGRASHTGDSVNTMWPQPGGVRIHGFRGMPMPEMIQPGDKIIQYVYLDPDDKPDWAMLAVRGDGRFMHNVVLGDFDYESFRADLGNILMYTELNHSVWHEIFYVVDDPTYERAVKVMGRKFADGLKAGSDAGRATVDRIAYQAEHFFPLGKRPAAGSWHRIEIDTDQVGLTGKLVDGFAYLSKGGDAHWDYTALQRNGKTARIFCEDTVGIDRALLPDVKINVPGLTKGTKIKVLFEQRTITAQDGYFTDDFVGIDTYGHEAYAVEGDMMGYVKDPDRELPRMMPSGYGYNYGPTSVHIYEIQD